MNVVVTTSHGSISVFQVSIGLPVGRYYFKSVPHLLSVFKISRYRFGISLCFKTPCADPEILLPSQSPDFD